MPTERDVDLAWAAGLFEGEGCISTSDAAPRLRLRLTSTDFDVVERFQQIVGVGTISPERPRQVHHKIAYRWQSGKTGDVIEVLYSFMPHFGERRRAKAEEALQSVLERA